MVVPWWCHRPEQLVTREDLDHKLTRGLDQLAAGSWTGTELGKNPISQPRRCYPQPTFFYSLFLLNVTFWSNVSIVIPIFVGFGLVEVRENLLYAFIFAWSLTVMTVTTCSDVWAVDFSRVSTTSLDAGVSLDPPPGGWRNRSASGMAETKGEKAEKGDKTEKTEARTVPVWMSFCSCHQTWPSWTWKIHHSWMIFPLTSPFTWDFPARHV